MKATQKAPAIEALLTAVTGNHRPSSVAELRCVFGGHAGEHSMEFKNEISKREYTISGMCQTCQDKVFG